MFIGSYYHKLEAKGRLSLPKPYRAQTSEWVITVGLDGGLFLFPSSDFQQQLAQLASLHFNKKDQRSKTLYLTLPLCTVSQSGVEKNDRLFSTSHCIDCFCKTGTQRFIFSGCRIQSIHITIIRALTLHYIVIF